MSRGYVEPGPNEHFKRDRACTCVAPGTSLCRLEMNKRVGQGIRGPSLIEELKHARRERLAELLSKAQVAEVAARSPQV